MISSDGSAFVQHAAIKALEHSIDFCRKNFDNIEERNVILQVAYLLFSCVANHLMQDNLQCNSISRRKSKNCRHSVPCCYRRSVLSIFTALHGTGALSCKLIHLGSNLFAKITMAAIASENMEAAKQGIEFWTTIADEVH